MTTTLNLDDYVTARTILDGPLHDDRTQVRSVEVLDVDSFGRDDLCEEDVAYCTLDDARPEVVMAAQSYIENSVIVQPTSSENNRQRSSNDYDVAIRGKFTRVQIDPMRAPHWYDNKECLDDDERAEVLGAIDGE